MHTNCKGSYYATFSIFLRRNILPSILFSNTPNLKRSSKVVSFTAVQNYEIVVLYISIFRFLDNECEGNSFIRMIASILRIECIINFFVIVTLINIVHFWITIVCSLVGVYQLHRETCSFDLQGSSEYKGNMFL